MTWFIFALLSALFLSASTIAEKHALKRLHTIDLSAAVAFVNVILALPFLFFIDFSKVTLFSLALIFGSALAAAIAFYLVAKAVRHLQISFAAPLLSLSPGTSALLGYAILGEVLGGSDILGIAAMIVGSYILTLDPQHDLLYPVRFFFKSRYVHFILASLLFYSLGAVIDRAIVFDFEIPIANYMVFVHLFIALLYLPAIYLFGGSVRSALRALSSGGENIFLVAVFTISYRFFQMNALSAAFVGVVSAIKRSSSFFTTLVGGELFHERNLVRKIFASLLIVAGALLIAL
ncbi:DMT family transporter [Patescibacteria group bacterium]|nr:MAG: DMT family transporter [Patescibacteria group bacterium]